MSGTPVDVTPVKPTVRRKLAHPKVINSRFQRPHSKKARIDSQGDEESTDIPANGCDGVEESGGSSQELCSQSTTSLPRVIWEPQRLNSPLLSESEDTRENDALKSVNVDSPQAKTANASSTPYLKRIWRGSKARFESISSAECPSSKSETEGRRTSGAWMNQMYSLVSQLEDRNSRSPTPGRSESSAATQEYTRVTDKADVTPDKAGNTLYSRRRKLTVTPTPPTSYAKPDINCSLFNDSIEEFGADLLLSDSDDSSWVEKPTVMERVTGGSKRTPLPLVSGTHTAKSTGPEWTQSTLPGSVDRGSSEVDTANGKEVTTTSVGRNGESVKYEPTTPDVKVEARLPIKQEVTTPPNPIGRLRKGSPGTPFRRYNSHDSAIKSPVAAEKSSRVADSQGDRERTTLNLIEQKRQQALDRLNSRKGSFVKHRSMDCTPTGSSCTQRLNTDSNEKLLDSQLSTDSLHRLIDEKRKMAAEKLQKHREESGRDRSDSLSGTIRQLTPPSSQEKVVNHPETVLSQAKGNDRIERSQSSSQRSSVPLDGPQRSSLPLDSVMEDLENNTPVKSITKPLNHKSDALSSQTNRTCDLSKANQQSAFQQSMSSNESPPTLLTSTTNNTQPHRSVKSSDVKSSNVKSSNAKSSNQTLDDRTRQIIEEKRKAALEKLRQSKNLAGS